MLRVGLELTVNSNGVKFWESIGASQFILGVIKEGYKIPFYCTPTPVYLQNNKSALQNSDFVRSAITELLNVGSVVECIVPLVVINPLSVSIQPNGKKRLILDLRHVNFFVKKSKIKFEGAKSFLQCLLARPCAWACSFDIKSGYHHIEICVSDQQFLGFAWVFEGVTKYFKFTVLPFGLSGGPYIFSKVMRPLVKYWRSKATSIVVYLDDGISAAQSFSKCEEHSLVVRSDLFQSGFVPNKDKCQWVPIQVICWLGIFWDFKNNSMFIPLEKISGIFDEVVKIMSCKSVSARNLARVTGRIISNFLIMGDVCELMTKAMHRLIESRIGWDAQVVLDSDVLVELKFWHEQLHRLNSRPIWREHALPSRVVYSDASAIGCAAFISMNGKPVSHKNWDAIEMKQSSTWRELMCVKHALQSFANLLKGSLVKWYTDNQGVAAIVKTGSSKVHLHKLAMEIFSLTKEHDVIIDMEWIPRSGNEVADYLSKIVDFDDWRVKDSYFGAVDSIWGPFTVDCFANSVNAKVPRFYSLFFQLGSFGVDSLAFDWGPENCWLVPPVYLTPRVLMHFLYCQSRGVLVVPFWPTSLFWPYHIQESGAFKSFVVDTLFVQNGSDVFVQGANKETCFGSPSFNTPVLFLKLNGTKTSLVHWV